MAVKQLFGRVVCCCNKCGHVWIVRADHDIKEVSNCPRCRSIKWNENSDK